MKKGSLHEDYKDFLNAIYEKYDIAQKKDFEDYMKDLISDVQNLRIDNIQNLFYYGISKYSKNAYRGN